MSAFIIMMKSTSMLLYRRYYYCTVVSSEDRQPAADGVMMHGTIITGIFWICVLSVVRYVADD